MAYTRDMEQNCRSCGKKTRWVRCPRCNGKGKTMTTQCSHCNNTGYKCSNGSGDRYHG